MEETAILNIHQRINAVMGEVDYIKKDKKIEIGKGGYTVTGHDAVTKLIHPLLVEHGINIIPSLVSMEQDGNRTKMSMIFKWVNVDNPEDVVEQSWFSYGIDPQDKGPGKAISYAQRYAVLKTLHIETGDADIEDDDMDHEPGEEVSKAPAIQETPAPKKSIVHDTPESSTKTNGVDRLEGTISEKQGKMVYAIMLGAGFDNVTMMEYLQQEFSVKRCSHIPRESFDVFLEELRAGKITPENIEAVDVPF
jgi:hypothetical protein